MPIYSLLGGVKTRWLRPPFKSEEIPLSQKQLMFPKKGLCAIWLKKVQPESIQP